MLPHLIKNADRVHVAEFMKSGRLLLRSAKFFAESDDPQRRDDLEGKRGLRILPHVSILTDTNSLPTPDNIRFTTTIAGMSAPIFFGAGCKAEIQTVLPHAFIFSVSEQRIAEYGNGAFVIVDPGGFRDELCRAVTAYGQPVDVFRLGPVEYGGYKNTVIDQSEYERARQSISTSNLFDGYFRKPATRHDGVDLRAEKEWRFVYVPKLQDHTPDELLISHPPLVQYCELLP